MSTTTTGVVTLTDFSQLPEPHEGHLELHHGEVVTVPPPKRGHQRIQRRIQAALIPPLGSTGGVEVEMAFRPKAEYELWRADVAYLSANRDAATEDDEYVLGAPELVVEVLSPSNTAEEIEDKRQMCMANGCVSFWVVSPKHQTVSVTEGQVTNHYGISSTVRSTLLPISLAVVEILG